MSKWKLTEEELPNEGDHVLVKYDEEDEYGEDWMYNICRYIDGSFQDNWRYGTYEEVNKPKYWIKIEDLEKNLNG